MAKMNRQAMKDYDFACDMVECGEFETADMLALGMISAEEYAQVRAESAKAIGWIASLDAPGFELYLKGMITTEQARSRAFGMMAENFPGVEMTLEETALALGGLTRERARQLENKALAKARRIMAWRPLKAEHLGDLEAAPYYRSRPVHCSSAD